MDLGETLHLTTRAAWRGWLAEHHDLQDEVWLVYARKQTGEPRITYNDAVEVALCYGWIDSNQMGIDGASFAQRFSRRQPKSALSEMNKQRIRALVAAGEMTQAGLDATAAVFDPSAPDELVLAPDVIEAIRVDAQTWRNFEALPEPYKRIRLAFIEGARKRPAEFEKRLRHFVKMTSQGKKYGWVKEMVGK